MSHTRPWERGRKIMVMDIGELETIQFETMLIEQLLKTDELKDRRDRKAFKAINRTLMKELKIIKKQQKEIENEKYRRKFFSKL